MGKKRQSEVLEGQVRRTVKERESVVSSDTRELQHRWLSWEKDKGESQGQRGGKRDAWAGKGAKYSMGTERMFAGVGRRAKADGMDLDTMEDSEG